jgi:hypothetical protein
VRGGPLVLSVALLTMSTGARAIELMLGPRALAEALDIGQSRIDSVRTRFHRPYRLVVARAPVDYIEVVTPFRRVALAAEARTRLGERAFGQREARAVLGDAPEQIDLLVELTFHPQNTFIGVPAYEVRLLPVTAETTPVEPRDVMSVPRFGPRIEGMPLPYPYPMTSPGLPGGQPLTGGTIVIRLDGLTVNANGIYDIIVAEQGKELSRTRLDLRGLR